ncbi:MAG: sugar phosphate nucleotidyltransferase [bacterium]
MNEVRKAVIPAAGLGSRMAPLTDFIPKEMLPIGPKPAIGYIIDEIFRSGIDDCAVILNRKKKILENYLLLKRKSGFHIKLFYQSAPSGIGDALLMARKFTGNESFAVILPDNIFLSEKPGILQLISFFKKREVSCLGLVKLRKSEEAGFEGGEWFGAERISGSGFRIKKKRNRKTEIRGFGRYVFTPEIFPCLKKTKEKVVGEFNEGEACMELAADAKLFGVLLDGKGYDIGNPAGYLKAQREFLC